MFGYAREEAASTKVHRVVDSIEDYIKLLKDHIRATHEEYAKRREEADDKIRASKNKHEEDREFHQDQLVAIRDLKIGGGSTKAKFTTGYVIVSINKKNKTAVVQSLTNGQKKICHLQHLRKDTAANAETIPVKNSAIEAVRAQARRSS